MMRRGLLALAVLVATVAPVHAQGMTLLPAGTQFFDNATGAPLASGVLYTCQIGSACPGTTQNTWQDVGLTTPNSNPVTLTSTGRLPNGLYSNGASYKLVLQSSSGGAEFTQDNVPSPAGYNIATLQGTTVPFQAATVLTLASNTVTPTRSLHALDTSGGAGTLNTINTSGVTAPFLLYLYGNNPGADPVTITNGAGNITLLGSSFTLSNASAWILLMLRGTTWYEILRVNGVSPAQGCAWTVVGKTASSAPALCQLVEQTSGSTITVTLPAASTCTPLQNMIGLKNDTANVITVARTGSDTIDGATSFSTYGIQYESFDFVCNAAGTGWMIR